MRFYRNTWLPILVAITSIVLLVVSANAAEGPQDLSKNRRVTAIPPPTRLYETPILAANGSNIALAVSDYQREACQLWFSSDAGKSWAQRGTPQPPTLPNCSNAGFNGPRGLALGSDGTLLYSFRAGEGATGVDAVSRSVDGGRTWEGVLEPGGSNTRVAFGPFGEAYATWVQGGQIMLSASGDRGATFFDPQVAVPSSNRPVGNNLVIGPQGEIYIFFLDRSRSDPVLGAGPPTVSVAISTDGAETWSVSPIDRGTERTVLSTQQPVGAVDPDTGALSVVWADVRNGLYPGSNDNNAVVRDWDVFSSSSTDGGKTWSPTKRVNDNPVGDVTIQYRPWITISNGRVYIAWYDYRHDPAGGNGADAFDQPGLADVYSAISTDQGESFSPNRRVTDYPINRFQGIWSCCFIQAPLNLAPTPTGAVAVWSDTRFGNAVTGSQDITAARLTPGGNDVDVTRISQGRERSVALSRVAFPAGGTFGQANGDFGEATVVIAPENNVALGLVGATLARDRGGSLLLSRAADLPIGLQREVKRLGAQRAYVVGTEKDLGPEIEKQLLSLGVDDIQRIGGSGPSDIARKVAEMVAPMPSYHPTAQPVPDNTAVIVLSQPPSGIATREAAAAAGIGPMLNYPVLLVTPESVPPETERAITESGIRHTLVVASEERIPDEVMSQLPDPKRLSGSGVAATSRAVADELLARGGPKNVVLVASSADARTAIVTGAAAGRVGASLLLVPRRSLRQPSSRWIDAHSGDLDRIYVATPET